MKKKSINLFVIIAFVATLYPMLAGFMKKDNKTNLAGLVVSDEQPKLTIESWLSREYQDLKDDYNNDHWAFKELYVRLNNQFYYKAFNQIRVNSFVLGKDNYVYSEGYI